MSLVIPHVFPGFLLFPCPYRPFATDINSRLPASMIGKRVLWIPHLSNQLSLAAGGLRFPAHISRSSHLAKPIHLPPPFRAVASRTMTTSMTPSKRDPTLTTRSNQADNLERLLDKDGFKTWGFVIFRCTYQNNSDWEKFMARFLRPIPKFLEYYSGLDLLDKFAATVLEDRSFEGTTVAVLRDHFNQWATTALQEEQGVQNGNRGRAGRYQFFVMVDRGALESVLSAPDDDEDTGFVRLVQAGWEPEELDEDELRERNGAEPEEEPLEGCTEHDVGWMNVRYRDVEVLFVHMTDSIHWDMYYSRPPEIQKLR